MAVAGGMSVAQAARNEHSAISAKGLIKNFIEPIGRRFTMAKSLAETPLLAV